MDTRLDDRIVERQETIMGGNAGWEWLIPILATILLSTAAYLWGTCP